jgi:predicted secreted protein
MHSQPTPAAAPAPAPISEARLAANQANAQFSTGPTSLAGKAASSLNAVKTALTGRTVLLPTDDAAAYQRHLRNYEKDLRPATQREADLVQSIADASWRLQRIPALEMTIYAQGRVQFAELFNDQDPALRPGLIDLHTALACEKQLRNLQLQEGRIHRRREKDLAELRQAQSERRTRDTDALETASRALIQARRAGKPFDPAHLHPELGFEFSTADIETYGTGNTPVLDIGYIAFKRSAANLASQQAAA